MSDIRDHPSVIALLKDPDSFGTSGGPPPRGYACEKCFMKGVPRLPPNPSRADELRVQKERWAMAPLYRHCQKCGTVRVHFPYPRD